MECFLGPDMWDILATSYLALLDQFTTEVVKATLSTRPTQDRPV